MLPAANRMRTAADFAGHDPSGHQGGPRVGCRLRGSVGGWPTARRPGGQQGGRQLRHPSPGGPTHPRCRGPTASGTLPRGHPRRGAGAAGRRHGPDLRESAAIAVAPALAGRSGRVDRMTASAVRPSGPRRVGVGPLDRLGAAVGAHPADPRLPAGDLPADPAELPVPSELLGLRAWARSRPMVRCKDFLLGAGGSSGATRGTVVDWTRCRPRGTGYRTCWRTANHGMERWALAALRARTSRKASHTSCSSSTG